MKNTLLRIAFISAFFILMKENGYSVGSGGYANQVPSARAMGRANSVAASVDDASAVSFNPARLTSIKGTEISLGGTFQNISTDYDNQAGVTDSMVSNTGFTPNFHIASNLNSDKFSIGLGVNVPFGIGTEWGPESPLRYIATKTDLSVMDVNPAFAYKINNVVSVGVGIDYYKVTEVSAESKVNVAGLNSTLGAPDNAPDGDFKLEGDGDDFGFNFGVSLTPFEKHLFGLSYRSGAAIDVDGEVSFNNMSGASAGVFGTDYKTNAESKVYVPREIQLGYAFVASEQTTIEIDAQWDEWSVFKDQNVKLSETDPTRLSILSGSNPTPKNWENVWSTGIGIEHNFKNNLSVRAGYGFFDSPIPNSSFEASTPDSDMHMFTLGAGYLINNFRTDIGIQLFQLNERHVDNSVGQANGTTGNGTYDSHAEYYGINFGYKFGQGS